MAPPKTKVLDPVYITTERLDQIAPVIKGWDQNVSDLSHHIIPPREHSDIDRLIFSLLDCLEGAILQWQARWSPTESPTEPQTGGRQAEHNVPQWSATERVVLIALLQFIPCLGRRKIMLFGQALGRNQIIAVILMAGFGKKFDRKKISSATETMKKRIWNLEEGIKSKLIETGADQSEFDRESARSLLGAHDRFAGPGTSPWYPRISSDSTTDNDPLGSAPVILPWPQWVLKFMRVDNLNDQELPSTWPEYLRDWVATAINPATPPVKKQGKQAQGATTGGKSGTIRKADTSQSSIEPAAKRSRTIHQQNPPHPAAAPQAPAEQRPLVPESTGEAIVGGLHGCQAADLGAAQILVCLRQGVPVPSIAQPASSRQRVDTARHGTAPAASQHGSSTPATAYYWRRSSDPTLQSSDDASTGKRVMSMGYILQGGIEGPVSEPAIGSAQPKASRPRMLSEGDAKGQIPQLDSPPTHVDRPCEVRELQYQLVPGSSGSDNSNASNQAQHGTSSFGGHQCGTFTPPPSSPPEGPRHKRPFWVTR